MNEQIEIEYKILLNKDIYLQIIEDFKNYIINDYIQTNHYLIHPLLQEKRYMLRIREKNNQYELTLKRPVGEHRLETNIDIDENIKNKILNHEEVHNEIFNILNNEGIKQEELQNLFSLTTHRIDIALNEGILSVDENHYLNITDYELEYEVNDQDKGYQRFIQIINQYHLKYNHNCESKFKRALDANRI
jgi:uncharacterized protein YjbK